MQTPSLSKIPSFSSSRARQSIHQSNSTCAHHDQIISSDKYNHNLPQHCFDGGVHVSLRCLGCPVSSISQLHTSNSLSSSPQKSLKSSLLNYPFSPSSSFSFHSPSAAGRSLKWTAPNSPFAPSSSSSSSSSSFVYSSLASSLPSAPWVGLKGPPLSNNPLSSSLSSSPSPPPFKCYNHGKCSCDYMKTHACAKGPLSSNSFPPSSSSSSSSSTFSFSHNHNMGSSTRQAGKCNCNLISLAKDFLTEKLGLTDEEKEQLSQEKEEPSQKEEEELSQEDDEEELSQGSPQSAIKFPKQKEGSEASMGALAQRWREIQGLNHWEGLLDPLDLELRRTLLFYGDFNQAVYDSFETDAHSKYTGACRFLVEI